MEESNFLSMSRTKDVADWYSEEFITNSVVKFLKENGYKIHKDEAKIVEKGGKVIIASRYFTKEVIEVKGLPKENTRSHLLKTAAKDIYQNSTFKSSFAETLLNSLVNFGKYYSDESADIAMALPNVERYKAIIEKVHDYFSANDLELKIYLVNKEGAVEVSNLK